MKTPITRFMAYQQSRNDIQALVIHRNAEVARGLALLLGSERGISIAASATNMQHGAHWARIKQPDVVILDADLPNMSTEWSLACLKEGAPAAQFVILASGLRPGAQTTAPAEAQVVKTTDPVEKLVGAVRRSAFRGHPASSLFSRTAA